MSLLPIPVPHSCRSKSGGHQGQCPRARQSLRGLRHIPSAASLAKTLPLALKTDIYSQGCISAAADRSAVGFDEVIYLGDSDPPLGSPGHTPEAAVIWCRFTASNYFTFCASCPPPFPLQIRQEGAHRRSTTNTCSKIAPNCCCGGFRLLQELH